MYVFEATANTRNYLGFQGISKMFYKQHEPLRSSRLQMFFKIGTLKDFALFTGKHLLRTSFLQNISDGCFWLLLFRENLGMVEKMSFMIKDWF